MSYSEKKTFHIITILNANGIVYWFVIVLVFPETNEITSIPYIPFKKYVNIQMIFCNYFVCFQVLDYVKKLFLAFARQNNDIFNLF